MAYVAANLHWFALLVGALVFFHELGHFLVAKACGVKVLRFCLGFGPRLLRFTHGETEYQISLLPLGGYVKMLGETPGVAVAPAEQARAFAGRPVWQRTAIVLAGPCSNFLLALVVYFAMFIGPQTFGDTRLGVVTEGDPAYLAGLRPGDRVTAVDGHEVDRWDTLREAIAARPGQRLQVTYERDGMLRDATVVAAAREQENAFEELESRGRVGISLQYLRPVLGVVDPDSPAAQAGLRSGDVVTHVGGTPVAAWHEVRALVAATPRGTPVRLRVRRGEMAREVAVQPAPPPAGLADTGAAAADAPAGYTGLVDLDVVIARVEPGTPAASIGLQPGDRLLALRIVGPQGTAIERRIAVWGIDLAALGVDARSELTLTVQRGRQVLRWPFRPQARQERDALSNPRTEYVLGAHNDPSVLATYARAHDVGVLEAARAAAQQVGDDAQLIGRGLARLVRGSLPMSTMGGPIMLFVIAEQSAKRGWSTFGRTMAVVSVNLGILNLLPIPVLDGGHLLFCAIEVIGRRPPSPRLRELAQGLGLALMLVLMVVVFRNDVLRFFGAGAAP